MEATKRRSVLRQQRRKSKDKHFQQLENEHECVAAEAKDSRREPCCIIS
jgi:hypothetical protein